ncbi:hypothetical protein HanHA300_Chr14g0513971 [Helianthus annuus]|nr:hypothetical protein HanHA300_Chr14g0513971 [Helianthus annuus]KAJ0484675.1 hypothetical protein HanHA89_Chr14g0559511 [Helianthus annuus]KAJ0655227.1 hypothetical protein HanLR1_Chr14g0521801 [Helianthus annuus]
MSDYPKSFFNIVRNGYVLVIQVCFGNLERYKYVEVKIFVKSIKWVKMGVYSFWYDLHR